jgi:4-hydroxy-tetrahydrodipicolinate reductase
VIYKIGICGASGKMGLEIANLAQEGFKFRDTSFELSDAVAHSSRITSIDGVSVRTFKEPPREPVNIWIDFSRPEATIQLLNQIDTPVVIGTTGFSDEQWKLVEKYATKHSVLFAPNMAPGMNAMVEMIEKSSFSPSLEFEVVASESHHKHKKDSPSGTMKRLLSSLESLGYKNIPVQVSRVGEIFGLHTLKFVSADEEITIEHRVSNRRVFAKGALVAAQFLLNQKKPKIYSFAEVLES